MKAIFNLPAWKNKITRAAIILLLALLPVAWATQAVPNPYTALLGICICGAVLVLVYIGARKRSCPRLEALRSELK